MARGGQVSWLEAAVFAFPGLTAPVASSNRRSETRSDLSQWRGRAGFTPASENDPPAESDCGAKVAGPLLGGNRPHSSRIRSYFSIFL